MSQQSGSIPKSGTAVNWGSEEAGGIRGLWFETALARLLTMRV